MKEDRVNRIAMDVLDAAIAASNHSQWYISYIFVPGTGSINVRAFMKQDDRGKTESPINRAVYLYGNPRDVCKRLYSIIDLINEL